MKNIAIIAALSFCIALSGCKGNGSTGASSDVAPGDTTKGLNDGNGAEGSGSGSAGKGTVGDTTSTPQDTVNGAPMPKAPDSAKQIK